MTMLNCDVAKIWTKAVRMGTVILVAAQFAGCAGMGPKTVARDRFDYVGAISESWKRQTLLNLLKTRYLDAPVFMDVASVINQYSLEQQVGLGLSGEFYNRGEPSFISPEIAVTGKYTDRPTITYDPLVGERFTRSFLRPIPLAGILLLLQGGYPADYVFRICVQAINGIKNGYRGGLMAQDADPKFYEVLSLFHNIQVMDGMGMRKKLVNDRENLVMFFRRMESETQNEKTERLMKLLGLKTDVREFPIVFGRFATEDTEIAILSRSMLQIMVEYASYIDVPESDVAEGRTYTNHQKSPLKELELRPLIRVYNSTSRPQNAYVAVPYRDRWFWIDDRDMYTKNTFYFLMILFSFTERGESEQKGPILTVPTN